MKTPVLDEFISLWINAFSRSPKCKLSWTMITGLQPPSYSATRWWSRWEVIKQVLETFGDVEAFIYGNELSPASKLKLHQLFSDPNKKIQLQIELAIAVDSGEPLVKATYNLEGDGPLALLCYKKK